VSFVPISTAFRAGASLLVSWLFQLDRHFIQLAGEHEWCRVLVADRSTGISTNEQVAHAIERFMMNSMRK
jgi:hypothetical protein